MTKKLTSNIVDLNLLNDCFFGETALQIDVINIFLTETPSKVDSIKSGISEQNHIQIKENAHYLKSTFSTLGVPLNKEYLQLEELARENESLSKINAIFESTLPTFNKCYQEYERILNELKNN